MLNLTFITGAGLSKAAGIPTYQDMKRANYVSPYHADIREQPQNILRHFNERATIISNTIPTDAHYLINQLKQYYNVKVLTQNIDDLHERAGGNERDIVHLHGCIFDLRTIDGCCVKRHTDGILQVGDVCPHGNQWRHDIILYKEKLANFDQAKHILALTDVLAIVGCSMETNTPWLLLEQVHDQCPIYFIDPNPQHAPKQSMVIQDKAYLGIWKFINSLCL